MRIRREKICCIYKITSPTGKIYVGQTIDYYLRVSFYKRIECKFQRKLFHSLLKYGFENHIMEIVEVCLEEELNILEKHYIKSYKSFNTEFGLNLRDGGKGDSKMSKESREKMSKARKGKKPPEKTRLKLLLRDENGEIMSPKNKKLRRKEQYKKYKYDLKEYHKKYEANNKEKSRCRKKKWYLANKQKQLDIAKIWRNENKEKMNEWNRRYWTKNKEKILTRRKELKKERLRCIDGKST